MYEKYQQAPQDNVLANISSNAREAMRLAVEAKKLLAQLVEIKSKFKRITEEVLPALALETDGQKEFLIDGKKIKVQTLITANCPAPTATDPELKKRRSRIFQWLDEKNFGKIINREFRIYLGREEKEQMEKVSQFVKDNKLAAGHHHAIHPATMNKFAKECMKAGVDLPDFFQARSVEVAKLPSEFKVQWAKISASGVEEDED
jgi:hypothetical protein